MRIVHSIEPIYDSNSKILILGSFPSSTSREVGFYYGHPQNRFWSVLSDVLNEPRPICVEAKKEMLLKHGIALWDVVKSCEITGSADSSIKNAVANDFNIIFNNSNVNAVFTTGKTAHDLYKKFTGEESIYLPSPSSANCIVKYEKMIEEYKKILRFL